MRQRHLEGRVRAWCVTNDMTLEKLAQEIGFTRYVYLHRRLNGEVRLSLDDAIALSEKTGVPIAEIAELYVGDFGLRPGQRDFRSRPKAK